MSARVLNPAMMSEMGHRSGIGGGGGGGGITKTRVSPSRAALERVRRDLFGPVDHAAARALAERELQAQSLLDADRWGFDFNLEKPKINSRFEWKEITSSDIVPEPYALRGMNFIGKQTTVMRNIDNNKNDNCNVKTWTRKRVAIVAAAVADAVNTAAAAVAANSISSPVLISTINNHINNGQRKIETTPPQESRLPRINDNINNINDCDDYNNDIYTRKNVSIETKTPTTPNVNSSVITRKQQSSITDFMKSRKRTLNHTTKSIVELPEKMPRTTSRQISS